MLQIERERETHKGPLTLQPRWLRQEAAVQYSGLSRAHLYRLAGRGLIKSSCLRSSKHKQRAIRLFDRESIDELMIANSRKWLGTDVLPKQEPNPNSERGALKSLQAKEPQDDSR
jgi:hypothetical protein